MRRLLPVNVVLATVLAWSVPAARAADAAAVGLVKTVSGTAAVVRQGQRLPARPGLALHERDTLRTEADGTLGVILRDDTRLTLGPDSEIVIDGFAFEPAEARLGLLLRMARGAVSYVSGTIARLAPGAVRVDTPVATATVRGTHLLVRVEGKPAR